MMNRYFTLSERQQFWLLMLGAAVLIFAGIGLRDPWPADEPRFALMGRDMWLTGNWLLPMRGGELYPDKPPVFMWAIGLFYGLTGNLRVAFLLPSALAGLGTLWLVYDLGRRLWSHRIGLVAGLLLAGSVQFILQAKTAQIDALVCFWITLGCYGLMRHLLDGPAWHWYALGWFAMGLGIITKGVGFLPLLMLIPWAVERWRRPRPDEITGGWRWWVFGPLMLLLAVALWGVPMLWAVATSGDPAFAEYRDNILLKQTATRYVHSLGHQQPFHYYLSSVIPLFWLPLSLLAFWLVRPWLRAVRAGDRRIILPLFWVPLVVLFFSLSPGKRGVYILPALPMLALASAPFAAEAWRKPLFQRLLWSLVLLLSLILLTLGVAGLAGADWALGLVAEYQIEPWWQLALTGLAGLAIAAWQWRRPARSWVLFMPVLWLSWSLLFWPALNPVRTPEALMQRAFASLPAGGELAIVKFKGQHLLFSPGPITHFGYRVPLPVQLSEAWRWLGERPERRLMVPEWVLARHPECLDPATGIALGRAHGDSWLLLDPGARRPDCRPEPPARRFHYRPPVAP